VVDESARIDSIPRWFEGVYMNAADNLLYSSVPNASTSERGTIGKEDGKVAGPLYSVAPGIQAYAFDRHPGWL
jgi:hypothetical protein